MKGTEIVTAEGVRPDCRECKSALQPITVCSIPEQSNYYCEKCHICYPMTKAQREMEYNIDQQRQLKKR